MDDIFDTLPGKVINTRVRIPIRMPTLLKFSIEQLALSRDDMAKLLDLALVTTHDTLYLIANNANTIQVRDHIVSDIRRMIDIGTTECFKLLPGYLAVIKEFYTIITLFTGEIRRTYVSDFTRTLIMLDIESVTILKD